MRKWIDQNIFLSNALTASLWHHAVKIDKLSDRLMSIGGIFHNLAPKYLNEAKFKGVEFCLDKPA